MGNGDRPAPPDVRRVKADEEVRGHALVVVLDAHVVAHGAPGGFILRRRACDVDGLGENSVRHHSTPGAGMSWKTQRPSVPSVPATTCRETPSAGTSCRSG